MDVSTLGKPSLDSWQEVTSNLDGLLGRSTDSREAHSGNPSLLSTSNDTNLSAHRLLKCMDLGVKMR